ncbi:hypothetical protein CROQUDRAFT_682373 [Cronartium quercuum f. sp. fusiforme G11]|uniref:Uncharacterized protein n=1 Tax=Cronartium quercuum f. sp. fusiforme G11 TaxID=708437 RepID=A0A9P6NDS6_9BASI|nr:hypothetical protein CROQUDRAFT_682373 [Cronartium quercuum f. sp. fusiforme G11]
MDCVTVVLDYGCTLEQQLGLFLFIYHQGLILSVKSPPEPCNGMHENALGLRSPCNLARNFLQWALFNLLMVWFMNVFDSQ